MQVEYSISEEDYLEAQRAHAGWSERLLPVIGCLLILAGIFNLVHDQRHLGAALGAILFGALIAFGRRILRSYTYRQDKRLHDHFVATFSDEGIQASASTGTASQSWSAFTRYVETRNLFLLYQGPVCLNVFPKRYFASGDTDAFRSLVQQKLGGGDKIERKRLSPIAWILAAVVTVAFVLMLLTIRNVLRQSAPTAKPAETQTTK